MKGSEQSLGEALRWCRANGYGGAAVSRHALEQADELNHRLMVALLKHHGGRDGKCGTCGEVTHPTIPPREQAG